MLNKRALPNLRPGENVLKITADRMAPGMGLDVSIEYRVDGWLRRSTRFIRRFPCYFRIDASNVPEEVHDNFDQRFNEGRLQMVAINMQLRPLQGPVAAKQDASLDERAAIDAFARSYPHPADFTHRQPAERPERDVRETSGFFPQGDEIRNDEPAMQALLGQLRSGGTERRWIAAEDLSGYPQALDVLLGQLPQADGDLTIFLCKALARIKDKRAIATLMAKWKRAAAERQAAAISLTYWRPSAIAAWCRR